MSLITLLDTQNIVRDAINTMHVLPASKVENPEQTKIYCEESVAALLKEIVNTYKLQYNLIYTYYNKSTVLKVGHTKKTNEEVGTAKTLEHYYQHQFLHNTAAIIDEIFEQSDALEKYSKYSADPEAKEKTYKAFLLFIEESIDVLHFAVEYGCLFAEQYVVMNKLSNPGDFANQFPEILYSDNSFKEEVITTIERWVAEAKGPYVKEYHTGILTAPNFEETISPDVEENVANVRYLIRHFAFKDWKVYPDTYFEGDKLKELFIESFTIIQKLYSQIIQGCASFSEYFLKYTNSTLVSNTSLAKESENLKLGMAVDLVYGAYVAKNWINMQRQKEDPRYTGKDFGNIIGVAV